MKKFTVFVILGTRPEAIKMAPLIIQLNKNENFICKVVSTGQHKEMLKQVFTFFKIKVDFELNVMTKNQTLSSLSQKIILGLDKLFLNNKPDLIYVHGDTTTSMVSSLVAFYHQIKIAHIEAGLRTNNLLSPFPEEANRKINGVLANLHFAPTENAKKSLIKENTEKSKIFVTGNTVIDALFLTKNKLKSNNELTFDNGLKLKSLKDKKIILVTGHRRENIGEGFISICKALKTIANRHEQVHIVFPVHLNPNVKDVVFKYLSQVNNITLTSPFSYPEFVNIMSASYLILTDSGGVQEEAPSLGVPVLVMRDTTERPEAVEAGTVKLVGANCDRIVDEVSLLLTNKKYYFDMSKSSNPYGDGEACKKIISQTIDFLT
ncbi:UDP-N-acetylglucosamine 2-epimerase (non-hydrolyzing) [Flammeovirga sp. SubArs3]|uniref:non-hydrolyzing UDP-N-acetylglucosamine 2-epimerase n=1 Tax=Flammeovirga sp. SubArs3 TaxID=2995316 RepID=UPI00248AEC78|nr:UDP-N-acetylglucosamine 2-epimerase (non-hydrolyzing) [Flammeovirga sp. SubArs3]